jgi:hypothetical protein
VADQISVVTCDRDSRGPCDYQDQKHCKAMPLEYGSYCQYETDFMQKRKDDLVKVFVGTQNFYRAELHFDGFWLNHTLLWEICSIYANDLKPIRQFHAIEGGCDRPRRAALLARLVATRRPIQINDFGSPDLASNNRKKVLGINEHYALHVLMHFLELPASTFKLEGIDKPISDLRFMFNFRDPQPEALVCIARLLKLVAQVHSGARTQTGR